MKTWMAALAVATALPAAAQDFPGYRAGNYTGVNGVFFNPANIADSRYRFDVNLFSPIDTITEGPCTVKLAMPLEAPALCPNI